jgi:hypothetical protein
MIATTVNTMAAAMHSLSCFVVLMFLPLLAPIERADRTSW